MSTSIVAVASIALAVLVGLMAIAWLGWRWFRMQAMRERMRAILRAEGGTAESPRRRRRAPLPIRDSSDVRFSFVMRDVERRPGDWRSWYRLSLAYADSGDRRRARKAMRQAMRLFVDGRGPTAAGTSA